MKLNALFVHLLCSTPSQLTHSLYARSHCSVPVCPASTTAVRYALQPLYTTGDVTLVWLYVSISESKYGLK